MKLAQVTLENFRGIRQLELPLREDLNVLVGENAAGKSTVLDGIAIGLGVMLSRFPDIGGIGFRKKGDIYSTFSEMDLDEIKGMLGIVSAYARVTLESADGKTWDVTKSRDRTQKTLVQIPRPQGRKEIYEYVDALVDQLNEDPAATVDLPIMAHYGTDRAVLKLPERRRGFAKTLNRIDALRDCLKQSTNFKNVFEWFIVQEDEERRGQQRLKDWDYRLPALEAVREAIQRMFPGSRQPQTLTNPLRFVLVLDINGKQEELALDQLSDGYRALLALVMDLARRMAQANPRRGADAIDSQAIVLIDEVDLHLHPRWQQRVLVDLANAFPNAQFIVTTHSPQVLTSIRPEQIVRLKRGEAGIVAERAQSSYGAESGRLLEEIMDVDRRPPAATNQFTKVLADYRVRIERGEGEGDDAKALRRQLDALSPQDPALIRADMEIRRRKLLGK